MIFTLPKKLSAAQGGGPAPAWWPRGPLAYVEWYTRFPGAPDPTHLMYAVSKPVLRTDGLPQGAIIPLEQIRQSCQLIPAFRDCPRGAVPTDWMSENVLDVANRFYLNNWAGIYAYQTLW